jgi:hypothetical protein
LTQFAIGDTFFDHADALCEASLRSDFARFGADCRLRVAGWHSLRGDQSGRRIVGRRGR